MIDIIISDEFGSHGESIKSAISVGYGSDISSRIQIIPYWNPALEEATNNDDIIALIRSTDGVASYVDDVEIIYPRVQTFFPLGSNSFIELNVFAEQEPPIIATCGAGDTEERNNTAYGKGLEFWDEDTAPESTPDDYSSYSNGIILGKLLKIKDTLECTWWEARYRARVTADRDEPNRETSIWDLRNGYGKINVSSAINYSGTIPQDAYINDEHYSALVNNSIQISVTIKSKNSINAVMKLYTYSNNIVTDYNESIVDENDEIIIAEEVG